MTKFFDSFSHDVFAPLDFDKSEKAEAKPFAFTCERCDGKGKIMKMYGRKGLLPITCPECRGRKGFQNDRATRTKNRVASQKRKAAAMLDSMMAFEKEHPELIAGLREVASWNSFAASLVEQFDARGSLSEKQALAAHKMLAKVAEREAERNADKPKVDAAKIREAFDTALTNGKKRRALLADLNGSTVKMTPARDNVRIWIKVDGEFCGGIQADNSIRLNRDAPEGLQEAIERIAIDPAKEARLYGQKTGKCCCCGRELTKSGSIQMGIGPVCAENWGF